MVFPRIALCFLANFALCLASTIALAGPESTAEGNKRVLILAQHDSIQPATQETIRAVVAALAQRLPGNVEIYSEYMDAARFPEPDDFARFKSGIVAKYAALPLDVVMPLGQDALNFMLANRSEIAPRVPIVFAAVDAQDASRASSQPGVGGLISHFDVRRTVELARQLQPDARRLVVMTGSAVFDRSWEATARTALRDFDPTIQIDYVSGLTLDGFKQVAAELPRDAMLLIITILQDASGRQFVSRNAAAEIAQASGAPAYAHYSTYMGIGIVGGSMQTFAQMGADVAEIAADVLLNENQSPQIHESVARPVIDWRQLRRWGIDESRVPADAELMFYEPSIWDEYRSLIQATIVVILLQAATIFALIVESRRRRSTADRLTQERVEFARLSRVSQLGELSGALAHELRQPLAAILANAEAGRRLLAKQPPDFAEVKEILDDIVSDNQRAATVISQLRNMIVKGESEFDRVDLNQAVRSTLKLVNSELLTRQTTVSFLDEKQSFLVQGNLAQLQQVILNLLLNAADAMTELTPAKRRITVETRLRKDGSRELAVSDLGPGLSAQMMADAFKPFFTSKQTGLGLGLAISRSIAQSHGGSLGFDEAWEVGARIILVLPAP